MLLIYEGILTVPQYNTALQPNKSNYDKYVITVIIVIDQIALLNDPFLPGIYQTVTKQV
jgi:hypothetical protein